MELEYKKSKLPPGSRVWINARHSPGKNQNIQIQLKILREHCAYNGLIITEEFVDAGMSGSNSNRDGFTRMLERVESNKKKLVDGVILYDSSRLARHFKDATWARVLLDRRGYTLEILLDDDFPDDIYGYIMRGIKDNANAEQREIQNQKIREHLRQYLTLRDAKGEYLRFWPMAVPWGFVGVPRELPVINTITHVKKVRQCLKPDYSLWPLGQEVFNLRVGGLSYRNIEKRTGFLTSRDIDFSNSDVLSRYYQIFFRNTIYKGVLTYKELCIPDFIEPMVTEQVWTAANASAWDKKRQQWQGGLHPKAGKVSHPFMLAGLCECGYCHAPMYSDAQTVKGKLYRYYICSVRKRKGTTNCTESRRSRADILEQVVYQFTLDYYLTPDHTRSIVERVNQLLDQAVSQDNQLDLLNDTISDLERRIKNLIRLAEEGEDIISRLRELRAQKEVRVIERDNLLTGQPVKGLKATQPQVERYLDTIREKILDQNEVKAGLWQIIRRVLVNRESATVFYQPPIYNFTDSNLKLIYGKLQIGYTIKLPSQVGADGDLCFVSSPSSALGV